MDNVTLEDINLIQQSKTFEFLSNDGMDSSNIAGSIRNFTSESPNHLKGEAWDKVYTGEVDAENYKLGTNYAANAHFALQEAKYIKVTINGAAGRIPRPHNPLAPHRKSLYI